MELYIDRGESEINDSILQEMIKEKDTLEKEMGTKLCWEELEARRGSRIAIYRDGSISENEKMLDEIKVWVIEYLLKFKQVFDQRIKKWK